MFKVLRLVNGRTRIYNPGNLSPESIVLIPIQYCLHAVIYLCSFLRLNPGLISIIINIYQVLTVCQAL